jgi:hypothetical protein
MTQNNITSNYDLQLFLKILNINVTIRSKNDNIFDRVARNGSYIINLSDKENPGTHWVALFIRNKVGVFFDSYGLPPPEIIGQFTHKKKLIYSTDTIQSIDSTTCGFFCVWFLYVFNNLDETYLTYQQYGYALNQFLRKFDKNNTEKNDDILRREIKKIFTIVRK